MAATGHQLGRLRGGLRALPAALVRGRPQLYMDAIGLLARLGIRTSAASDARGRLCVLQPIADGSEVFGAVLVLLAADAPDPSIFGSLETLAGNAGGVLRRARLHGEVERAYLSTVTALANALEAKDLQTHEHASATSRLAVAVGTELRLTPRRAPRPRVRGRAPRRRQDRDPRRDPSRRGPLSDEEWAYVRDHTVIGERILRGIPFLRSAASAVRSAHERWDGAGYPDGLAGEADPAARADRVRLRHLGRDDVRPPLPRRAHGATRPSGASRPRRATSSTRRSSPRCSRSSAAEAAPTSASRPSGAT